MSTHDEHKPSMADAGPQSLAQSFHLIRSLIPQGQRVVTVSPHAKVAKALALMGEHDYSQLPVVAGTLVLGLFSYRSLTSRLLKMGSLKEAVRDLPVDEFVEKAAFAQPSESWESVLEHLERQNAVLVGTAEHLVGIVTAMDVLGYLREVANPFVMVAEIELSLRHIIDACAGGDLLEQCILRSLSNKYTSDEMPKGLSHLTFDDHGQIICHGENWPMFSRVFGEGEWQRKHTADRLRQVRELRNDVFHFRRRLRQADCEALAGHREWLQMKTKEFDAMQHRPTAPKSAGPKGSTIRHERDEARGRRVQGVGRPLNYDGRLPLAEVLEKCRREGDRIEIGHTHGERDLARRGWDYVQGKPWKWRNPGTNRGVAVAANWIPGSRFVQIVEALRPRGSEEHKPTGGR